MATETQSQPSHATLLVRYIEVWQVDETGQQLTLIANRCIDNPDATPVAEKTVVGPGEGIAGRAWNQKSATVLQEEPSELIASLSQQAGTDLAGVVAIPTFDRTEIRGVVVLGLGTGHGAIEAWSRDERDELSLSSSWYGGLPGFEFISRYVRFPKGAGIPGEVWKTRRPQLAREPGRNPRFVRSFENDPAHLTTAVGIPVGSDSGFASSVLLLLPSSAVPLANDFELWATRSGRNEDESITPILETVQTAAGLFDKSSNDWRIRIAEQVARTAAPQLITDTKLLPDPARVCLAVPTYHDGELIAVWTLIF
ncbi:MAG: hypothetical protein AB8G99_00880 [Planctomycetaceae bacterium]